MDTPVTPQSILNFMQRMVLLPAWLEPRLQALGAAWWRRVAQADARAGWRWLALNWQKVAAWWITAGLGLTALFLLATLIAWQNPEVMMLRTVGWAQSLLLHSSKLGWWGGLLVLVLALPILLPAALLTLGVLLAGVMAIGLFGPLLLVALVAFAGLLLVAVLKRSGSWLVSFVFESLTRADQNTNLARMVRDVLGLRGSSTTVENKPRWLEGDELARFVAENKAANKGAPLLLGRAEGKPFVYWTEKHFFITASARSGKGRDLIIPNLRLYPESVVVLDPKAELCMATAAARERMGNTIAAFDPYGLTGRPGARFNPLASIRTSGQLVRGADYLAEALVIGPDDHWNESARGLIRALALHLLTCPDSQLRGRRRDLPSLRELLTGFLDVTLEDMAQSDALDGLVSRLAETFIGIPPNEKGGIVNTARRGTKWLDNPELADLFRDSPDCISFEDLRDPDKRLSVFVCLPPDVFGTYPQVSRLLVTFALDTMMRSLTGRRRGVMFILDELAQLDHLPIVARAFTLGAGYGIQVWAVFQSVEQAQKLYPLDALYGSSGVRCFFNLADPVSCEYASKCASGVLAPAEVRHLPGLAMLTLLDGANPLIVERLGPPPAAK